MTTTTTTDTSGTDGTIVMSREAASRLADLLDHCEHVLADPAVRADLAEFCTHRPGISSGWLIDLLALHTLHLRARLDETTEGRR